MDNLNQSCPIFGVKISRMNQQQAVARCRERIDQREGGYACFANVHSVTESVQFPEVRASLESATFRFADGLPLVWVSKMKGQPIGSRVCGPDFMKQMIAETQDKLHGFIGGTPGQGDEIGKRFHLRSVCHSPPFRAFSEKNAHEDWAHFCAKIPRGERAPPVVWVGLGAPKQEQWMRAVSALAPETLFLGVGAAFDFLTDAKHRAPESLQRLGLEWLFRLYQEPRRLWRRYLMTNTRFICWVALELWDIRILRNEIK